MKAMKLTASATTLLLTAALLLSGCTGEPASTTASTAGSKPASTTAADTSGTTASHGTTPDTPETPADVNLEALIEKIYGGISGIEFPSTVTDVLDLSDNDRFSYYFGIDKPASAASAVASVPFAGSIPYTMALLELNDASDIANIASSIEKGVDPSKWICVTASTVKTAYKGNVILLIMDRDAARANAVIDAFTKAMD